MMLQFLFGKQRQNEVDDKDALNSMMASPTALETPLLPASPTDNGQSQNTKSHHEEPRQEHQDIMEETKDTLLSDTDHAKENSNIIEYNDDSSPKLDNFVDFMAQVLSFPKINSAFWQKTLVAGWYVLAICGTVSGAVPLFYFGLSTLTVGMIVATCSFWQSTCSASRNTMVVEWCSGGALTRTLDHSLAQQSLLGIILLAPLGCVLVVSALQTSLTDSENPLAFMTVAVLAIFLGLAVGIAWKRGILLSTCHAWLVKNGWRRIVLVTAVACHTFVRSGYWFDSIHWQPLSLALMAAELFGEQQNKSKSHDDPKDDRDDDDEEPVQEGAEAQNAQNQNVYQAFKNKFSVYQRGLLVAIAFGPVLWQESDECDPSWLLCATLALVLFQLFWETILMYQVAYDARHRGTVPQGCSFIIRSPLGRACLVTLVVVLWLCTTAISNSVGYALIHSVKESSSHAGLPDFLW